MWRFAGVLPLALAIGGCGFADAPGTPLIVAHRVGAGYWPENSRSALRAAIARHDAGIEFDVVLTRDRAPVLSHDPALNQKLCTAVDGTRLTHRVLIQDLTLDELRAGYRCGGLRDEEMPGAEVVADTHVSFGELLEALRGEPAMRVEIDIKYQPGETPSPSEFAEALIASWRKAALPNVWWVAADRAEVIRAVKAVDPTVQARIAWPRFPEGGSDTNTALRAEAGAMFGFTDLVKVVRDARADGISSPYQVMDRRSIETLRDEGMTVEVWTLDDKPLIEAYCRWPLEAILTNYPELAKCR